MPEINSHEPGNFCWMELGTPDQEGAKAFYAGLFGWQANDLPMGPGETYTMFHIDGKNTGAAYQLTPEMASQGVPPHWMLYVSVTDADASSRKIETLGGKVLKGPFDVADAGRMAVAQDPAGAIFSIWQPNRSKGIDIAGKENTFCWADLSTLDPWKAKTFYEGLFGWKISAEPNDTSGYLHIQNGAPYIGGIQDAAQRNPSVPPHWLIYFQTTDCDGSVKKAQERGARIQLPSMSLPNVSRFAVLSDPHGAVFALYEPLNAA